MDVRELFNKLKYDELDQLIGIMSFNKNEYRDYIKLAHEILNCKIINYDPDEKDDSETINNLNEEELSFLKNIVSDVYDMLESVRYQIDYENELRVLYTMETRFSIELDNIKTKVKK